MRKAVRAALSTARTARTPGPLARYGQLVTKGRLRRDAAQVAVLEHLGRLHRVLAREREARDADAAARAVWATTTKEEEAPPKECSSMIDPRAVGRKQELRKRRGTTGSEALDRVLNQSKDEVYEPRTPRIPKGLYVHGHVGRGKSLCCDLFFEGLSGYKKRRVHFHQFMLEVHRRLHDARAECKRQHKRPPSTRDALKALGKELAAEAEILVFDEMQITDARSRRLETPSHHRCDSSPREKALGGLFSEFRCSAQVADAMVARQLFDACWDAGLVLVATSNRPPEALYEGGPNRQYFSPFVTRLREQCRVVCLDGESDHRRLRLSRSDEEEAPPVRYMVQHLGEAHALAAAATQLSAAAPKVLGAVRAESLDLPHGRSITPDICLATWASRSSLRENSVEGAVFAFEALCGSERGAGDFHAVARAYPSLAVADVPAFSLRDHDAARRFITLVDECYERRNLLVVVARQGPDALFPSEDVFERQLSSEKTAGVDRASGPVCDPADDEASAALDLVSVRELAWAFKRCASRLSEMAAPDWPQKLTEASASA